MRTLNRSGALPAVEGGFASYNPRFQIPAGPNALVGGPDNGGVATARFGWADLATGLVRNTRLAQTDLLGFVYPTPRNWQRTFWDSTRRAWVSRTGFPLTLARAADVWARFAGGAYPGQQVYANLLDGTCMSVARNTGPIDGFELTPWYAVSETAPGELAIISIWSFFTP